jgi:hypothetical protein
MVVCDFVHPGVRESLGRATQVLMAELRDGNVAEEYMAAVHQIQGVEEIAEMHMKK